MLRSIYYSRGVAAWNDLIEITHRPDPIIEQAAAATIAEHWVAKGRVMRSTRFFRNFSKKGSAPCHLLRQRSFSKSKTLGLCKSSDVGEGTVCH